MSQAKQQPPRIDYLNLFLDQAPLALRISGRCMDPLIRHGAAVQIRRQSRYWPGDVLVIREQSGRYLCHRLLGYYPKGGGLRYLTQSDNGRKPDNAAPRSAIIGRVTGGECAGVIARPPLLHRLRALGRFGRFALGAPARRLSRAAGRTRIPAP